MTVATRRRVAAHLLHVPDAARLLGTGLDLRRDHRVCRRRVEPSCTHQGVAPPTALQAAQTGGTALGAVVVVDVG